MRITSHREQHHAALHFFFAWWYDPYDIPRTRIHPKRLYISSTKKKSGNKTKHKPRQKYRVAINEKIKEQSRQDFDKCKYWFLSLIDVPEYMKAITFQKGNNDFVYAVIQDCINEGLVSSSYVYNTNPDEIKIIHDKRAINSAGKKWLNEHADIGKVIII